MGIQKGDSAPMERSAQLFRLLHIITAIEAQPGRLNVKKLAQSLEYSERTIYRDLATLNLAGVPIFFDTYKGGYTFTPGFFFPPVNINFSELLSLAIASQVLSPTPYKKTLTPFLDKIMAGLNSEDRLLFRRIAKKFTVQLGELIESSLKKDVFISLNEAVIKNRRVSISYQSTSKRKATDREIDPYGLAFRGSAWYLVGFCHLRKEIRTFRISRVKKIKILPESFEIPSDFSIEKYFGEAWRVWRGEKRLVKIRFDKEVAGFFKEAKWHPTQKIESQPDGSLIFSVEVGSLEEISSWILSWGESAEILEPEELKKLVYQRAHSITQKYPEYER